MKIATRFGRLATIATCFAAIAGCAPAKRPLPTSSWGDRYSFQYEPPSVATPNSAKATVIVVDPHYKDSESAFTDSAYTGVAKGFAKSMGVDLDKLIVAKGMTSVGPYSSLDDVPYPDKKNADITLAPRVFLVTQTKYGEWTHDFQTYAKPCKVRTFEMKIGGWVSYVMQEPLSGEKMWVKKLELEESSVTGQEIYEAKPRRQGNYVVGWDEGALLYNGRTEAVADAVREFYPIIMEKAWVYLNTDEIIHLKEKTREIRALKRY